MSMDYPSADVHRFSNHVFSIFELLLEVEEETITRTVSIFRFASFSFSTVFVCWLFSNFTKSASLCLPGASRLRVEGTVRFSALISRALSYQ